MYPLVQTSVFACLRALNSPWRLAPYLGISDVKWSCFFSITEKRLLARQAPSLMINNLISPASG